jgi:hypothetical protein
MPGQQRPGPLCGTESARIDSGTNCRAASPRPGTVGLGGRGKTAPEPVKFSKLWDAYPSDKPYVDAKGNVPKGYENQCAIKVSVALHGVGVELKGFTGAQVTIKGKRAAIRAQEMPGWLSKAIIPGIANPPRDITGSDWQDKARNLTGIVYFENYWLREGEKTPSGDHIDLWNGSRLTMSGWAGVAQGVLRFSLGVDAGPGYSDLGKSTRILLWSIA